MGEVQAPGAVDDRHDGALVAACAGALPGSGSSSATCAAPAVVRACAAPGSMVAMPRTEVST